MLAILDQAHMPLLLVLGLAVFIGTLGARIFQKLRIPQVVGYIVIGLIVGRTGAGLIDEQLIAKLLPFNLFALGVIGFMIGGELHLDIFRRYGRQFFIILLAEGLTAFLIVGLGVSAVAMMIFPPAQAIALGLVLGAIASATAPAATVDVLWEYKTRGVLTTAVFAIVAMDDGLALVLYGVASSIATQLAGTSESGLLASMGWTVYELLGAVLLGAGAGAALNYLLRWSREHDKALTFTIGSLAIVIGLGIWLEVDLILAAMALGMVLANLAPRRSQESFQIVERFAPPIYVLFFVIVGARLDMGGMSAWMWTLGGVYVAGRTIGKMLGANLGARWAGSAESVRKYLGLCLFSQAGVAIGLAILASVHLPPQIGNVVILTVTATTFLVQIIGPTSVKIAVRRAGEVGLNVTEEDLIAAYSVGDVMDGQAPTFPRHTTIARILPVVSQTDTTTYPVTDEDGRLAGLLTLDHLKASFAGEGMSQWLVAFDLMEPVPDRATESMPLKEAFTRMQEQGLEYLPVVRSENDPTLLGVLEARAVNRFLSREVLRRRQLADPAADAAVVPGATA